jgi:alkanesulfonate monooxygenase SsuD/methylene tetrahydromethanopterin reductase-like flavin-dependent oxidoreductase (luciferase family)
MVERIAIVGSADRCRESLTEMMEAGVTAPVLFFPPPIDFERTVRAVATQIFPHFL